MFFFFNDTATTEIYTLSLHDALPISRYPTPGGRDSFDYLVELCEKGLARRYDHVTPELQERLRFELRTIKEMGLDRKSTRLNSSHANISYAVFCLKKKKDYVDVSRVL